MANSKYEYVRTFENNSTLLPNTYIVVRIDGRGFHKFSALYEFKKPNDAQALGLMQAAATALMKELPDIVLAYGLSDEFSFIFDRSCKLFDRRESKLLTTLVSSFTSYYIYLWSSFFPAKRLSAPLPSFDGRVVQYPTYQNLRDYLSWRQVDCHINNLYNTTFWALVQLGGMDTTEAEDQLKGTLAADKNEILFTRFNLNYNNEPEIFKKGSVIYRDYEAASTEGSLNTGAETNQAERSKTQREKERKRRAKACIVVAHCDIIKDDFWNNRPWLLPDNQEDLTLVT
ncbi:MAG: hypothetical protein Q9191_000062 [Dirinaria sp. TL-2023a]